MTEEEFYHKQHIDLLSNHLLENDWVWIYKKYHKVVEDVDIYYTLNPQLHSRSATYKRNGLLIRKTAIKSSRPFQCAYYPLTP